MTTAILSVVGVCRTVPFDFCSGSHDQIKLVAFLVGYFQQDIYMTAYVGLAGTALAFVLIVPPWPYFNRNPVTWLPKSNSISGFDVTVDGKKVS